MPQAYSDTFARIYNQRWQEFANSVAPCLARFYAATHTAQTNRHVLDLCCGTGQVAHNFLQHNYHVTGIDLSAGMLEQAVQNTRPFVEAGQAHFIQADAANFTLNRTFGLVLSTYDALNHLPDEQALRDCFACVAAVCEGWFIFDLNTRLGLRNWDSTFIMCEDQDLTLLHHGHFDRQTGRANAVFTGFLRQENGLYQRFEESIFNLALDMHTVRAWLLEAGFRSVRFAKIDALDMPIDEPEMESRVWFVCER